MNQPLSLDRFASLSAEMSSGKERTEVLQGAGISADAWEATQTFWLERLASDAGKKMVLVARYNALFFAEVERIGDRTKARFQLRRPKTAASERPKAGPPPYAEPHVGPPIPPPPRTSSSPPGSPSAAPPPLLGAERVASSSFPAPAMHGQYASSTPPGPRPQSFAPPPPSLPPYTARLTVDQFAALRAEIVNLPEAEHAEARGRYGIDAASWPREEAEWQKKLAGDKDLFAQYVQRFQYFRALMAPRR